MQIQFFVWERCWTSRIRRKVDSISNVSKIAIDGEPCEFEWNIFQRNTTLEILKEIQIKMATRRTRLEECEDLIIFMSMLNDIDGSKKGNYKDWFFFEF